MLRIGLSSTTATPALLTAVMPHADSRAFRAAERVAAVACVAVATAMAAQISVPLPFSPVPFTLQPMIVLLGGAALGARLGMASQLLYLTLGIAGLPVFAASPALPQGVARLLGPTGGYLMGYPLAAFVSGWLAERGLDRRYASSVVAMACGVSVYFASGVLWLSFVLQPAGGFVGALNLGFTPFIVGDLLKVLLAAGVMPAVWRLIGARAN
jgi:biotin transport system substrate-specific component